MRLVKAKLLLMKMTMMILNFSIWDNVKWHRFQGFEIRKVIDGYLELALCKLSV